MSFLVMAANEHHQFLAPASLQPVGSVKASQCLEQIQERVDKAATKGEELLSQILKVLAEHQTATRQLMEEQNQLLKVLFEARLKDPGKLLQPASVLAVDSRSINDKTSTAAHQSRGGNCTSDARVSTPPVTLKVSVNSEVHRMHLPDGCGNDLRYSHVSEAIHQVLAEGGVCVPKYRDQGGDLCSLTASTFEDFLRFAKDQQGERVLTVEIDETKPVADMEPTFIRNQMMMNLGGSSSNGAEGTGLQRQAGASGRGIPSLAKSWADIFTMGFAVDRFRILEALGPEVVAQKMSSEANYLALVSTLCLAMVFELWLALVSGGFDEALALNADDTSRAWPYDICYILVFISLALLAISTCANVLLGLQLSNLLDDDAEEFLKYAGFYVKLPYLGCLYGVFALLFAVVFISFFPLPIPLVDSITTSCISAVSFVVVTLAGATYIRATYAADAIGEPVSSKQDK